MVHDSVNETQAYQDVLDENQSKNKAIGQLFKDYSQLDDIKDVIEWRIESDRSIVITLPDKIRADKDLINDINKNKYTKKVSFE